MASAWIYQDDKQVKKHGADAASWYVGWIDPDGKKRCKSCGPGPEGHRNAEKLRKKREAELLTGTYQSNAQKTWEAFRAEYEAKIMSGMGTATRRLTAEVLDHFERIVKPVKMTGVKTQAVDAYRAKRRTEPGKKKGEAVSPATVNKELRHLRAVVRKSFKWGCVARMPDFEFERESKRLPRFVIGEHFAAIYQACASARTPADILHVAPADWWRGVLVFAYMTGWRVSEILALRREDLDLETGYALTRADDNKGGRDDRVKLHPVLVEHLRRMAGFDPFVFPWNQHERTLYVEFARIQKAARVQGADGRERPIHLPCRKQHEHTPACHLYGFHDFRRAFATMNADRLTADALQALMRHKSYQTTQVYINMARQIDEAVDMLHVPEVLRGKAAGG